MGFNQNTYIGFYFKVKHKIIETTEELVTYETESGEIFNDYVKFSSVTGEPTKKVVKKIIKKETVEDLHDFIDVLNKTDIEAEHYYDNYICTEFAPNPKDHTLIFLRGHDKHENYGGEIEQEEMYDIDIDIEESYDEFINNHKELYNELKQVFDYVKVSYAVINYAS